MTAPDPPADSRARRPFGDDRILDPAALKALAHPLRFQLIEVLLEQGPSTASELGRVVGESSGSTSYHLRQLAANGLIEEATELGSRRDRYWRVVSGGWTLDGYELLEREDTRDDMEMILDEVMRSRLQRIRRWHREGRQWGDDWIEATIEMTGRFRLTREELVAMRDDLLEVIDRWRTYQQDRRDDPATAPPGVVPISLQVDAFPTGPPPAPADERDAETQPPAAADEGATPPTA